ncbi:MAG: hypothetical protein NVSMB29_02420 [Candidatus Dormibacteria bacterium]
MTHDREVDILAAHGLSIVDEMPGTPFVLIRARRGDATAALIEERAVVAARRPTTVYALGSPGPDPTPDDPLFKAQWNLRQVGIPGAWSASTGVGATVAVLDTGVAYEDFGPFRRAPDLAGTRFAPGWDFVDKTGHPNDRPRPGRPSHGTHIAGTIAQTSGNGLGAAGMAPGATIMPIRVLAPDGSGTSWAVAQGVRFAADHGASVANLSLGNSTGSPDLELAIAYAQAKGVTVVAAAGDDGRPSLSFPAAYPGVIAVGATRFDKRRAPYSNYGPRLDLMAPGGDLSVDQDGDGLDDGIVQQTLYGSPSTFCYCFLEGTSTAAAHVSAAAAMLVSTGRATSPEEVQSALVRSAEPVGPAAEYGAGLLRVDRALALVGAQPRSARSAPPSGPPGSSTKSGGGDAPAGRPVAGLQAGGPGQTDSTSPTARVFGAAPWWTAASGAVATVALAIVLARRRRYRGRTASRRP